jgi:adenylyltransferase/sulfurtransferase
VTTAASPIDRITPAEVRDRLDRGEHLRLLDVREPIEHQIARIEGAELVPLGRLEEVVGRLDPGEELVLVCHHGIRSHHACELLRSRGFTRVRNMVGGIDRWSMEVDPAVPRY